VTVFMKLRSFPLLPLNQVQPEAADAIAVAPAPAPVPTGGGNRTGGNQSLANSVGLFGLSDALIALSVPDGGSPKAGTVS
jgi:hypothetical protein